jgi:hypothetical protein
VAVPYSLSGNIFSRTVKIIYRWPLIQTAELLTKARQQLARIKKGEAERTICNNGFRTAHGRPCIHDLMDVIESETTLLPEHFHSHWWIDQENAPAVVRQRVLEPRVLIRKRTRRRNQTGTGPNGTRREALYAERVDRNHPASPPQPSGAMPSGAPATQACMREVFIVQPPQAFDQMQDLSRQISRPPGAVASCLSSPSQQTGPSSSTIPAAWRPWPELQRQDHPHVVSRQIDRSPAIPPYFHPPIQQTGPTLSVNPVVQPPWPSPQHQDQISLPYPYQQHVPFVPVQGSSQMLAPSLSMQATSQAEQNQDAAFFRARKPPRGWGYVPYTSFGKES